MSDARTAIAEAKARWRQVAARHLVRKEELEAVIARGGPGADAARAELATVEGELREALAEIKALDGLAARAPADEARALAAEARALAGSAGRTGGGSVDEDPSIRSYEAEALDRARGYVRELDAQVKVNEELAELEESESPRPPSKKTI